MAQAPVVPFASKTTTSSPEEVTAAFRKFSAAGLDIYKTTNGWRLNKPARYLSNDELVLLARSLPTKPKE